MAVFKMMHTDRLPFFVLFEIIQHELTEEIIDIHVAKDTLVEDEMILLNGTRL